MSQNTKPEGNSKKSDQSGTAPAKAATSGKPTSPVTGVNQRQPSSSRVIFREYSSRDQPPHELPYSTITQVISPTPNKPRSILDKNKNRVSHVSLPSLKSTSQVANSTPGNPAPSNANQEGNKKETSTPVKPPKATQENNSKKGDQKQAESKAETNKNPKSANPIKGENMQPLLEGVSFANQTSKNLPPAATSPSQSAATTRQAIKSPEQGSLPSPASQGATNHRRSGRRGASNKEKQTKNHQTPETHSNSKSSPTSPSKSAKSIKGENMQPLLEGVSFANQTSKNLPPAATSPSQPAATTGQTIKSPEQGSLPSPASQATSHRTIHRRSRLRGASNKTKETENKTKQNRNDTTQKAHFNSQPTPSPSVKQGFSFAAAAGGKVPLLHCWLYFPQTKQLFPCQVTAKDPKSETPNLDILIDFAKNRTEKELCFFSVYNELWKEKFQPKKPTDALLSLQSGDILYASSSVRETILTCQKSDRYLVKLVLFTKKGNRLKEQLRNQLLDWLKLINPKITKQELCKDLHAQVNGLVDMEEAPVTSSIPNQASEQNRRDFYFQIPGKDASNASIIETEIAKELLFDNKRLLAYLAHKGMIIAEIDPTFASTTNKAFENYAQQFKERINWNDPTKSFNSASTTLKLDHPKEAKMNFTDMKVYDSVLNVWFSLKHIQFVGLPCKRIKFTINSYNKDQSDTTTSFDVARLQYYKVTTLDGHFSLTLYKKASPFYFHMETNQLQEHVTLVRLFRAWLGRDRREVKVNEKLVAARLNHPDLVGLVRSQRNALDLTEQVRVTKADLDALMSSALGGCGAKWPNYGTIKAEWKNDKRNARSLTRRVGQVFKERMSSQKATSCLVARDCKRIMRKLMDCLAMRIFKAKQMPDNQKKKSKTQKKNGQESNAKVQTQAQMIEIYNFVRKLLKQYYGARNAPADFARGKTKAITVNCETLYGLWEAPF